LNLRGFISVVCATKLPQNIFDGCVLTFVSYSTVQTAAAILYLTDTVNGLYVSHAHLSATDTFIALSAATPGDERVAVASRIKA
jgi:hypothetical protein